MISGFALQAASFSTKGQPLTGLNINPTFTPTTLYNEIILPKKSVQAIEKATIKSPVTVTIDVKNNGKFYALYVKAKNNANKIVSYNKFTALKDSKTKKPVSTKNAFAHTNIKYQLSNGAWTEIKKITPEKFALTISKA